MYILNWNPSKRQVEASFGGNVTHGEAECFLGELQELVSRDDVADFEFVLDYAKASRLDPTALETFDAARGMARFSGARLVTIVTPGEEDVALWTGAHLQEVLEGTERYVAFGLAA